MADDTQKSTIRVIGPRRGSSRKCGDDLSTYVVAAKCALLRDHEGNHRGGGYQWSHQTVRGVSQVTYGVDDG